MAEESRLKNRLVGAVVLLSLGAILLPAVLDFRGRGRDLPEPIEIPRPPDDSESRITPLAPPPARALPRQELGQPVVRELETPSFFEAIDQSPEHAAAVASPTPSTRDASPAPTPVPQAQAGGESAGLGAWIVQVATLNNKDAAYQLRDRLREQGLPVFVEEIRSAAGIAVRVRVGPELDQAAARRQQKRIADTLGIETVVLRYP